MGPGEGPEKERKERVLGQSGTDARAMKVSSAKEPKTKDEFVRSGRLEESRERDGFQAGRTKASEASMEEAEKREEAEQDASGKSERKRKSRGEISIVYAEDIPDPSDPDNPHKKRTVYRRGPTYPAPEFGLGGGFDGIF